MAASWTLTIANGQQSAGWPTYGGDSGGQRFSTSHQITPANISRLKPVWTYHTHALDTPRTGSQAASFEATPVLFHDALYLSTPFDVVIALDAATGSQRWTYDPAVHMLGDGDLTTSRGVATWSGKGNDACASRIFLGTLDARLIALDSQSGKPCADFGAGGSVDLTHDVHRTPGFVYGITSAPTVLGDVVVVGSSIPDNQAVDVPNGTVRAFDVRTGKQLWAWDPIASWASAQQLRTGGANSWSTISADASLGLLFVPTGSASPDYWGGTRPGDNRDADSVVALNARTGKRLWGFQVVHHNLWDYDVAAQPLLFTWRGTTPAIAIGTKMGQIFVLDRRTGTPLLPVTERPVPPSDVPGEQVWPTQPFSSIDPINPISLETPGVTLHRSSANQAFCDSQLAGKRYDGIYTPPSVRGSLEYPGPIGGVNWGSMAFSPVTNTLYANNNSDVYEVRLIPRMQMDARKPPIMLRPAMVHLTQLLGYNRRVLALALLLLATGSLLRRNPLPGWHFGLAAFVVLLAFPVHRLLATRTAHALASVRNQAILASRGEDYSPMHDTPYWMYRHPIMDHDGLPCAKMPWGALTAVDLNTGRQLFRVTHGTEVSGQKTGSLNVSGPMVTAGGVVFSAGTREPFFRAYDATTGDEIWHDRLPVPAQATPMSYEIGGRQYVVIADGGHGLLGTAQGDSVIAYALP
ncbi:MAG: pyrroloquinoline quinone-dependent dehydrogenase [Acidobacteriota bacterium]|nr:pyrroloquinoline quinone-dependent dehydrogenase [Acidobacteriota bacterium]